MPGRGLESSASSSGMDGRVTAPGERILSARRPRPARRPVYGGVAATIGDVLMTRRAHRWWPRVPLAALVLLLAGLAVAHITGHHHAEHAASCPGSHETRCADDVTAHSPLPAPAPAMDAGSARHEAIPPAHAVHSGRGSAVRPEGLLTRLCVSRT